MIPAINWVKKLEAEPEKVITADEGEQRPDLVADDSLLKDQLGFINKLSTDIARVTENIVE